MLSTPLLPHAYLHRLLKFNEIVGSMLLTWHDLHLCQSLIAEIRTAIERGAFAAWRQRFADGLTSAAD